MKSIPGLALNFGLAPNGTGKRIIWSSCINMPMDSTMATFTSIQDLVFPLKRKPGMNMK